MQVCLLKANSGYLPLQPRIGAWAVTLLYVKTHSDRKHKSKQTFDFGQNAGQRGKMCPASKLIIQMHETRSPTKCESTVQAEISDGRKNLSLKH